MQATFGSGVGRRWLNDVSWWGGAWRSVERVKMKWFFHEDWSIGAKNSTHSIRIPTLNVIIFWDLWDFLFSEILDLAEPTPKRAQQMTNECRLLHEPSKNIAKTTPLLLVCQPAEAKAQGERGCFCRARANTASAFERATVGTHGKRWGYFARLVPTKHRASHWGLARRVIGLFLHGFCQQASAL